MIIKEFLGLTNKSKARVFCIYKLLEVDIICEHKNFILIVLQVVFLNLENFNNSQKRIVMSFIPSFSQNHLLKKESYQILLAKII